MARAIRKFGTKYTFHWRNGFGSKREAKEMADWVRKRGRKVRVVRGQGEWELWTTL